MDLNIEDFDALRAYLTARKDGMQGARFRKLEGGVSNRTVLVEWPDGRSWVLKQALAKLRVSADWFSSPQRIAVEARALRWLNELAPPGTTPAFVFEDLPNYLMVMEAIPGPHANWKSILLAGRIVPHHFQQFAQLLGTIHRESSRSSDARAEFADTTYFESLRLDPYYLYAGRQVSEAREFLTTLVADTLRRKDSLVHGDFSPKNTLLYEGKLILLDYEVVHFGDPAFDLGFALTHFLSKAHHLPTAREQFARAAWLFWETYLQEVSKVAWADKLEPRVVRHTLGCLLARVAGKSPLEYLRPQEAQRQQRVVIDLIKDLPATVEQLMSQFFTKIEAHAEN